MELKQLDKYEVTHIIINSIFSTLIDSNIILYKNTV